MNHKILLFSACLVSLPMVGLPAEPAWHVNGKPSPIKEDRGSNAGFGACIFFTSDRDWLKKWNVPTEQTPSFAHADKLKLGEKGTLLIFFAYPKQVDGKIDVTWDVKTIRPNGEVRENKNLAGYSGLVSGPVSATFLAQAVVEYAAQHDDPKGIWHVEVVVHDNLRKVSVPVKTSFEISP